MTNPLPLFPNRKPQEAPQPPEPTQTTAPALESHQQPASAPSVDDAIKALIAATAQKPQIDRGEIESLINWQVSAAIDATQTETLAAVRSMVETTARNQQLENLKTLREAIQGTTEELSADLHRVMAEMIAAAIADFKPAARTIEVLQPGKPPVNVGIQHETFPVLLQFMAARLPVWITGPAGSGKTQATQNAAEALSLPFFSTSVCSQTTKADLFGFIDANGVYRPSAFRKAYETGGVFLLDEIDAGNPNVLVCLNQATSGNGCQFPDQFIHRSPDFILVANANTHGQGANRTYCGRNPIDSATLDRFAFLEWEYSETLETAAAGNDEWVSTVRAARAVIDSLGIGKTVSPRASIYGSQALAAGIDPETVRKAYLWKGSSPEEIRRISRQVPGSDSWKEIN